MKQFFVGNETVFKGENVSDYHLKSKSTTHAHNFNTCHSSNNVPEETYNNNL